MRLFSSKKGFGESWITITIGELIIAAIIIFGLFYMASNAFSAENVQDVYVSRELISSVNTAYSLNNDFNYIFQGFDQDYYIDVTAKNLFIHKKDGENYRRISPFLAPTEFSKNLEFTSLYPTKFIPLDSFFIRKSGNQLYFSEDVEINRNRFEGNFFTPIHLENPEKLSFENRFKTDLGDLIGDQNPNLILVIKTSDDEKTKIIYSESGDLYLDYLAYAINEEFLKASETISDLKFYPSPYENDLKEIYNHKNVILIELSKSLESSEDIDYYLSLGILTSKALSEALQD